MGWACRGLFYLLAHPFLDVKGSVLVGGVVVDDGVVVGWADWIDGWLWGLLGWVLAVGDRQATGPVGAVHFWFNSHSMLVFMWASDRTRWVFKRRRIAALAAPLRRLMVR